VLEEHRLDVELVRLELVEDQLRVVRAVVAPTPAWSRPTMKCEQP
jgi:hypothetical protein